MQDAMLPRVLREWGAGSHFARALVSRVCNCGGNATGICGAAGTLECAGAFEVGLLSLGGRDGGADEFAELNVREVVKDTVRGEEE
jgi:hypothetical protein